MHINFFQLRALSQNQRNNLCRRGSVDISNLVEIVKPILQDVKQQGDRAIFSYSLKFDGANYRQSCLRVSSESLEESTKSLDPQLRAAMELAIANITKFHAKQIENESWEMEISPGILAGEKTVPLDSVGLYVPRGKGSFPSMMMMAGVPAKVAGVQRIVVVTPPDTNGEPDPATVAAAALIGIEEIYAVGGVQAIAALAYGTESIPKVDKIVGPGSGYVLAAKQLVSTEVDTGLPAGPSEAIVFGDESTDPETACIDLLIEAEHGPDSSAFLVTTSESLAKSALRILPEMIAKLPEERRKYCETVLSGTGGVILAADQNDAAEFINEFAPEHLQLLTINYEAIFAKIKFAGEVLIGPYTPGTLANYAIGPNAILPTSGFARTASALSVRDFTRKMSFARLTKQGFDTLAPSVILLADYEGFPAHGNALRHRLAPKD